MTTLNFDVFWRDHGASAGMKQLGTDAGKASKTFGDLKLKTAALAGIAAKAGSALVKFGADSIKKASDLNETMNKMRIVFGKNATEIERWSKTSAEKLGLSQEAALSAASSFGLMFRQLGSSGAESTKLSQKVVKLAADLGSFHNLDTADVMERIQAAFRGEYDSLQQLVPTISAARVQKEALAETGKKNASALTDEEKAMAALNIITKESKAAQNDFAETSDGLANKQKTLTARLDELKAKIGGALIPVVSDLADELGKMFDEVDQGDIDNFADSVSTVAKAIGKVVEANQKLAEGQGGGLKEASDEWVSLKAHALDAMDDIASAGAKLGLVPKEFADAIHGMRVSADKDLIAAKKRYQDTKAEIEKKKIIAKLTADRDQQIKAYKAAKKELNDKDLTKERKAQLKADASKALAGAKIAQRGIDSVHGKTVTIRVRREDAGNIKSGKIGGAHGGTVTPTAIRRAPGGSVPGYSSGDRADNIPAWLTAGEYVHQASAVRFWGGGFMGAVNRMDRKAVARMSGGSGGGYTTIININAPNYVGSQDDLRRTLVDMNRRGQLEVIRR